MSVDLYNTAYINFHSTVWLFKGYNADYSTRIVSTGGRAILTNQGSLLYCASSPTFYGPVSIVTKPVATTDLIPSLTGYAITVQLPYIE